VCSPDLTATAYGKKMIELVDSVPWWAKVVLDPIVRAGLKSASKKCMQAGAMVYRTKARDLLAGRGALEPAFATSTPK
jgi:hypothetical protein